MEGAINPSGQDLELHVETALLPHGWARNVRIQMTDGVFTRVEEDAPPGPEGVLALAALPGMPNLHSHAFQRAIAGLVERRGSGDDSFWTWRELMYRFVDRITPEDVEAIAAQAYMEMLEAGFTRVGEFHYLHHDPAGRQYTDLAEMGARIASAAATAGIALTLLPVLYAHGGFGGAPVNGAQRRFVNGTDQYLRLVEASRAAVERLPHAIVGLAPHSLRAVTSEELSIVTSCAGTMPIHLHIAEQLREVEECRAWSGTRPVEWLLDHSSVDRRWCLVHATHMTESETIGLAHSGAVAGLCLTTEANLGDGLFPATAFRRANGRFGIGSDSNVSINMSEELRLLEYGQRLREHARNVMAGDDGCSTGRSLFEATVRGGAQALGALSGIQIGAPADMLSLDLNDVVFAERKEDELLDSLVFATSKGNLDGVWRAGRQVVCEGLHRDRSTISARYRSALRRLLRT